MDFEESWFDKVNERMKKMIYQWVYSYSCWNRQKRPGDARTRGFGTFSWTEGLTIEEIDELERRCSGYNYPTDYNIPARPTQDEIDKFLPVAFYSFTLASGKRAIVRTRYVGEGFYDKRWGAIISHGLILDDGEDWPSYPMEYFDSPVFWNELPQAVREEAIGYKDRPDSPQPAYLPALDIESLRPQGKYTPEGVAAKIAESESFAKMLSAFINAYMTTNTDVEPLCICAPYDDIPWLFAGLTMAFPLEVSGNFSFSTYLSDKMPTENEIGRWYQVAAMEKRNCSLDLEALPDADHYREYVDTLFGSRKLIMDFVQDFTGLEAADAPCVVSLFRFLRENGSISEENLQRVLKLLLEHGDQDVRKEFLAALTSGRGLPEKVDDTWLADVFALVSDYEELRPLCYDLFLQQRSRYQGDPLVFFSRMADQYPKEITVLWLEEYAAKDFSTTGLMFTFLSMCKNGNAKELDTPAWSVLFSEEAKEKADWSVILSKAPQAFPECLVAVLCCCPDVSARDKEFENIGRDLTRTVDFAREAIARGRSGAAKELLKKYLRREQAKPLDALKRIVVAVEDVDRSFAKSIFWDLFACVDGCISTIDKDSLEWLVARKEYVPQSNYQTFLKDIDANVDIPDGKNSAYLAILEKVLAEDEAKGFHSHRMGFIAWFLKTLESRRMASETRDLLKALDVFSDTYRGLSPEDQLRLCNRLLPILVDGSDEKNADSAIGQHKDILMFFGSSSAPRVRESLARRYVELIGGSLRKNRISAEDIRIVAGIRCALGELADNDLRSKILVEFAQHVFKKFSSDELTRVRRELDIRSGAEKRHWEELCDEVKKANTFLSKFKSAVGFIFKRS